MCRWGRGVTGLCKQRAGDGDLQRFGGEVGRFPEHGAGRWGEGRGVGFPMSRGTANGTTGFVALGIG